MVVTLEEIKQYVRIDSADEDELLLALPGRQRAFVKISCGAVLNPARRYRTRSGRRCCMGFLICMKTGSRRILRI